MENEIILNEEEMALINKFARRELLPDEVYTFCVNLCDNEIDRDYEAFSSKSLEELKGLFLGKTGIFDHSMKATSQSARIYSCFTENVHGVKNSMGEDYCVLKAKAYMVRTKENESLIKEIDAGIKKEVSVSCHMENTVCSICGKSLRFGECEHIKGRTYGGKLCFGLLENATDAYEWSFVAVPAQRNAGVTKGLDRLAKEGAEIVKTANSGKILSKEHLEAMNQKLADLEKSQNEVKALREILKEDIRRLCLVAMPEFQSQVVLKNCVTMAANELLNLRNQLLKQAGKVIPPVVQLQSAGKKISAENNSSFCI